MTNKEKKAARPKLDRDRWLMRRNNGGNLQKFYASRSSFLHVSQWFQPREVKHPSGAVTIVYDEQYTRAGKPHGSTYKKEQQA